MSSGRTALDNFVGAITTASFCGLVYLISLKAIPTANKDLANILLGALAAKFGDVVGYSFGSSRDAARANERAAATQTPAQPSVLDATRENGSAESKS